MIGPSRTDTSVVGKWWWTVDRLTLAALALLMTVGMILVVAASPAVAVRIGVDSFHFVQRQALFLVPATRVAAAVLLTAYFGGAIATQVRVGADWFPVVFPVLLGGLLWGGLSFSDTRVRRLLTTARTA